MIITVMKRPFTAVIKQDGKWWVGWIEELPGVNSQGRTKKQLLGNLRSALTEMLEMNREEALKAAVENYTEESILV